MQEQEIRKALAALVNVATLLGDELQPAPAEQKIGPVVFLEHVALVTIAGEV